jgi:hypothetical protein
VVAELGGSLQIGDREGGGTIVSVELPIAPVPSGPGAKA